MDKVMSIEDKIRRAEEIYYRRKNQELPDRENIKSPIREKRNLKLFKKMIKQMIICLIIYWAFYLIINNNYIFTEDFTNRVRGILSQDINFSEIYYGVVNTFNQDNQNSQTLKDTVEQKNDKYEPTTELQKTKDEIQNNQENIGGAEELNVTPKQIEKDINTSEVNGTIKDEPILSQMERDANYIKTTISFIKPVNGTISSMFGLRNPTTPSVPKNHTGTDIAAEIGTKIISATEGTVIYTSSKGDYGNHIKIQINDTIVLYAHCNKLYVKQGEVVRQGQEIAEVGATGNTTGPHLHFEIKYQDRYVDPQLILEL